MNSKTDAQMLANYIKALDYFPVDKNQLGNYNHMGAVLTDTVLQAGLNYKTVVEPRVQRVIRMYPDAKLTSHFLAAIHQDGANYILNWKHSEKPRRLIEITTYLFDCGVETEYDLHNWLLDFTNCQSLRMIKGIGPKTVDYLKNLVKIPSVAVDRHIRNFVKSAGIDCSNYEDIRLVVVNTANLLKISPADLDHAIWLFMSLKRFEPKNGEIQGSFTF